MTELRFTQSHEWIRADGREATVGITKYAAEQLGDQIAREVVGSRAESAGDEDDVRAAKTFANGLLDGGAFIGDGDLAGDSVTGVGELAAEPLLMRVEDEAEHQFAAGIDDFNVQGRKCAIGMGRFQRGFGVQGKRAISPQIQGRPQMS